MLAFFCISSLYIVYDCITVMGYSKHEFDTINMFYFPNKTLSYYTPSSPQRPLSCVPKMAIVERFRLYLFSGLAQGEGLEGPLLFPHTLYSKHEFDTINMFYFPNKNLS